MELDADQMMFESCNDPSPPPSVYEDMTFDPDPELIAKGLSRYSSPWTIYRQSIDISEQGV